MKILFFSANWCGQCKVVKPKFIDICKTYNFTNYEIIDADAANNDLITDYNIRNLPTAIFIFDENNDKRSVLRVLGFDIPREAELQIARYSKTN